MKIPPMPIRLPRLVPAGICLLAIFPLSQSVLAADQNQIGFVLSIKGRWTIDGYPLQRGEAVRAGGRIVPVASQSVAPGLRPQILVILFDGTHLLRRCDATVSACAETPLWLPTTLGDEPSLAQKLLAIAARLFLQQPERYFEAISRSGSLIGVYFADSVVELEAHDVNLTPLFSRAPVGEYRLEATRITLNGDAANHTTQSIDVTWNGKTAPGKITEGLLPGLYDVSIFHNEPDDQDEAASDIWVLVADREHFSAASTTYARFVAENEALSPVVGSQETRAIARAGLSSLAAQLPSSSEQ